MNSIFLKVQKHNIPNTSRVPTMHNSLPWRHNGRDGVSNHQPHDCLLNRLIRRKSKKASKLRVTGLCAGNSPVTGEFPAQMTSNGETVSSWWRHHFLFVFDLGQVLYQIRHSFGIRPRPKCQFVILWFKSMQSHVLIQVSGLTCFVHYDCRPPGFCFPLSEIEFISCVINS